MKCMYTLAAMLVILASCNKNGGNNAPQIKFKAITPSYNGNLLNQPLPILTIQLKDEDGDIGFDEMKDTSYLYVKNITVPPFKIDSFKFPTSLAMVAKASFKNFVDVELDLNGNVFIPGSAILYPSVRPSPSPRRDTTFFEVYAKDFKKNKSNVIRTDDPIIYITQ